MRKLFWNKELNGYKLVSLSLQETFSSSDSVPTDGEVQIIEGIKFIKKIMNIIGTP